jgi:multidrug resistance efflux pump
MIFAILGVVFLLVLLFVPIYFFWIKDKYADTDQTDDGQSES